MKGTDKLVRREEWARGKRKRRDRRRECGKAVETSLRITVRDMLDRECGRRQGRKRRKAGKEKKG